MPYMPGIWDLVRRGPHTAYYGGGVDFQGEAAGAGALPVVREGIGKRVTGSALPNPVRRGKRGVSAGGRQGSQGQLAQDFQDEVSCEVRTESLPSRRVEWPFGDVDVDAGAILVPARPGHRGDTGGGQPPSPKVPSV